MKQSVKLGRATIPLSWYLAMVRFPQTQTDMPNGAQDGQSSQRPGSIEDVIRMASHEPQLAGVVDARNRRNGEFPSDISGLYGAKHKPLGITQVLRDVLGLSTEYDRLIYLVSLEEGRDVRGEYQVIAGYHLAMFYGLMHYSEKDQERIVKAVVDCINRFCKSPLDLERSIQITDSIIEGFGLESMPRLMKDYRPFRNLSALVPNGDVYKIASAMNAPGLKHLPVPVLMQQELGYNPVQVGKVPVLYHRFVNTH